MTEQDWMTCGQPETMLAHLGAGASPRKLRLFMCACARRVLPAKPDAEMVTALAVAESFADGQAARAALSRAREALRKTQRARTRRWGVLYSDHIRSVPAWHAVRDQIVTGARDGTGCAAWSSTRKRHLGYSSMTYPEREYAAQADLVRDIFGNPFRPVSFAPAWLTSTVKSLASQMYESRDFGAMPILADALQDAGCTSDDILNHCRNSGPHARGCWVVDLVLGKV